MNVLLRGTDDDGNRLIHYASSLFNMKKKYILDIRNPCVDCASIQLPVWF